PDTTHQRIGLRLNRMTINMRLIAIVLSLAIPLNVVVGLVLWRLANAAREAQRMSLTYSARSIANAGDAELGEYIALSQAFANAPALQQDSIDDFEIQLRAELSSLAKTWVLLVADTEGRQLLNTAISQGAPLPTRPVEAKAAQQLSFGSGSPTVSDLYKSPF